MSDNQPAFPLLHDIVGNGHRAQRHAPMTATGQAKYFTVQKPLTDDQLRAHLLGQATYAVPLIGTDELARAGLIEQDGGGIDMARRILSAAEARGVVMFAIIVKGSDGHDGCHPWALYDGRYDPKAIRAQLKQIAEDAGASTNEIHPNNTNIRLPFGLHLRSQTRGRTLLQSGELFENDTELDAAERAVLALPLNGQPPEVIYKVINNPVAYKVISNSTPGRASLADVKAQFNAEHPPDQILLDYGAIQTSTKDFSCPFGCGHSHTNTLFIYEGRIFSRSPDCIVPKKRGLDPAGLEIKVKYRDDPVAFAKALNPIKKSQENASFERSIYQTKEQAADADRKRAKRLEDAAATRANVEQRRAKDTRLWPSDQAMLEAMLRIAGHRDWCRPSKDRLANETGYSLGTVKRSLMKLERLGYFVSQGDGSPSGRRQTAIRTFLCGSYFDTETIADANYDPQIYIASTESTLDPVGACEGGAVTPASEVHTPERRAKVDALGAMDDAAFADWYASHAPAENLKKFEPDPGFLDYSGIEKEVSAVFEDPIKSDSADLADPIKSAQPSAARLLAALYRRQGRDDAAAEWDARTEKLNSSDGIQIEKIEFSAGFQAVEPPENLIKPEIAAPDQPDGTDNCDYAKTGAAYIPAQDWTNGGRLDLSAWRDPTQIRMRETPLDPGELAQLDLPEDEPQVRCAPIEPEAADKYWALRGKAAKVTSDKQRRMLDSMADALMVWLPASEAAEARAARAVAPRGVCKGRRSQARGPKARPAPEMPMTLNL